MKLILQLAAPNTQAGQSRTLSEGRLSIGRGADNDWVLADPDRTLSKNHCRIDGSDAGFMLTDLSTNGVFLAGQGQAIGRGHSCALEDGDSFSLGPYVVSASIEGEHTNALRPEHGLSLPQEDEEAIFPSSRGSYSDQLAGNGSSASLSSGSLSSASLSSASLSSGSLSRADLLSPIAPVIAEPWLTDIPGGTFGPGRRAAPQGWDAPPDPATYAASGTFEAIDPLDTGLPEGSVPRDGFSQASEHLAAASTVMRLPQAQIVLPMDWNEVPAEAPPPGAAPVVDPAQAAPVAGPAQAAPLLGPAQAAPLLGPAQAAPLLGPAQVAPLLGPAKAAPLAGPAQAAPAWPPVLPTEPETPPAAVLPPAWLAAPEAGWEPPAPPAALPASWLTPVAGPDVAIMTRKTSEPEPVPDARASFPHAAVAPVIVAPAATPSFATPPAAIAPLAIPPDAAPPSAARPVVMQPVSRTQMAQPSSAAPPFAAREPAASAFTAPTPPDIIEPATVSAGEAAGQLVAAFLEGAGLPPDTLRGADTEASFREIGEMVRAAVDGVRDILATRALVKSEFRVDQTVLRRSDNNAMKFAPDAERCLAAMVGAAPPGFLPGPAAMRQSMDDIKRHELALVAAINKVFADVGRQLDPELIMAKAKQETGLGTMLPYAKEVRCWSIYTETHALLQDSGAANTGGSLLAPVAQAYDRQLRRGG